VNGNEGSDPSNTPLMVRNFEKFILPMLIRRVQRKLLEEDKRIAAESERQSRIDDAG
jgi:hypothetical protein